MSSALSRPTGPRDSDEMFAVHRQPLGDARGYLKALVNQYSGTLNFKTGSGRIVLDLANALPDIPHFEEQKVSLCHQVAEIVYPLAARLYAQAVAIRITISASPVPAPDTIDELAVLATLDLQHNVVSHCFLSPHHGLTEAQALAIPSGMSVICAPFHYHYHQIKDDMRTRPRHAASALPNRDWPNRAVNDPNDILPSRSLSDAELGVNQKHRPAPADDTFQNAPFPAPVFPVVPVIAAAAMTSKPVLAAVSRAASRFIAPMVFAPRTQLQAQPRGQDFPSAPSILATPVFNPPLPVLRLGAHRTQTLVSVPVPLPLPIVAASRTVSVATPTPIPTLPSTALLYPLFAQPAAIVHLSPPAAVPSISLPLAPLAPAMTPAPIILGAATLEHYQLAMSVVPGVKAMPPPQFVPPVMTYGMADMVAAPSYQPVVVSYQPQKPIALSAVAEPVQGRDAEAPAATPRPTAEPVQVANIETPTATPRPTAEPVQVASAEVPTAAPSRPIEPVQVANIETPAATSHPAAEPVQVASAEVPTAAPSRPAEPVQVARAEAPTVAPSRPAEPVQVANIETPTATPRPTAEPVQVASAEVPTAAPSRPIEPVQVANIETPAATSHPAAEPVQVASAEVPTAAPLRPVEPVQVANIETPAATPRPTAEPVQVASAEVPTAAPSRPIEPVQVANIETPAATSHPAAEPVQVASAEVPTAAPSRPDEPVQVASAEVPTATPRPTAEPVQVARAETPAATSHPTAEPVQVASAEAPTVAPSRPTEPVQVANIETPAATPRPTAEPVQVARAEVPTAAPSRPVEPVQVANIETPAATPRPVAATAEGSQIPAPMAPVHAESEIETAALTLTEHNQFEHKPADIQVEEVRYTPVSASSPRYIVPHVAGTGGAVQTAHFSYDAEPWAQKYWQHKMAIEARERGFPSPSINPRPVVQSNKATPQPQSQPKPQPIHVAETAIIAKPHIKLHFPIPGILPHGDGTEDV